MKKPVFVTVLGLQVLDLVLVLGPYVLDNNNVE